MVRFTGKRDEEPPIGHEWGKVSIQTPDHSHNHSFASNSSSVDIDWTQCSDDIDQLSQADILSQESLNDPVSQPLSYGDSQGSNTDALRFPKLFQPTFPKHNNSPFTSGRPDTAELSMMQYRGRTRERGLQPEFESPPSSQDQLHREYQQLQTRQFRVSRKPPSDNPRAPLWGRFQESLPGTIGDILTWFIGIVGLGFRYAQKPLAIFFAVYLVFGGLIIAQNMVTKSVYTSLSPLCRIPGVSWLDMPFCPTLVPKEGKNGESSGSDSSLEFNELMAVQERFEEVLEKSAQGVSLPMEMKRSEAAVRDLRTIVRYSTLQSKEELVLEFDGYIEAARTASNDLQRFNIHVGSAVDSVISINRWTSRYIDSLATEKEAQGWLSSWTSWVFSPFQPPVFSERILLDKYVEHTALVSDKIADLILEAQAVLRTLSKAEDHLELIYDFIMRTQKSVQGRKDEILWTLWTLVGANRGHLHNLNSQLTLLMQVNNQRAGAVNQVVELIFELNKIQAGLSDLRDRVAEPELARGRAEVPLSVHIETINKGVERLDNARSRIRVLENQRISEVLARGKPEERLIDA